MTYDINPYFRYIKNDKNVQLSNGVYNLIIENSEWETIISNKLVEKLEKKISNQTFEAIINSGLLVQENYFEENRYVRTKAFNITFEKFNEEELNKNIIVFGAGGTGTWITYLLKNSGFKNITVVDFDQIEISNLNRQIIYTKSDIGKDKVDVLNEYFDNELKVLKIKIKNYEQLEKIYSNYDYVFKCLDSPNDIHKWFLDVSHKTKIPFYSWMMSWDIIKNTKLLKFEQLDSKNKYGGTSMSHPYLIMNCSLEMFKEFTNEIKFGQIQKKSEVNPWIIIDNNEINVIIRYTLFLLISWFIHPAFLIIFNAFINKNKIELVNCSIIISLIIVIKSILLKNYNITNISVFLTLPIILSVLLHWIIRLIKK